MIACLWRSIWTEISENIYVDVSGFDLNIYEGQSFQKQFLVCNLFRLQNSFSYFICIFIKNLNIVGSYNLPLRERLLYIKIYWITIHVDCILNYISINLRKKVKLPL
jgi:hypothetical protein